MLVVVLVPLPINSAASALCFLWFVGVMSCPDDARRGRPSSTQVRVRVAGFILILAVFFGVLGIDFFQRVAWF